MDYVPQTSSTPYPYIFSQILSPLAISLSSGVYENYHFLAMKLLEFAKTNGILPYDQTLTGRYIEHLMQFESYPDDDPLSIEAEEIIDQIYDLYDSLSDINDKASTGGYVTPISIREGTETSRVNVASFSTGVLKDAVISLADTNDKCVEDLCGGSGGILETFLRMGAVGFNSYKNIDVNPNTGFDKFNETVKRFNDELPDPPNVQFVHAEINDYLTLAPPNPGIAYFSIHSAYYLNYPNRDLLRDANFSGVAHFSDFLFKDKDDEKDSDLSLLHRDGYLTGKIGNYSVVAEKMLFIHEVPLVYPAKFMSSLRQALNVSPSIAKSLGFWSNRLNVINSTISPMQGIEFELLDSNGYANFRRPKIYECDVIDYCFYSKMGYFVSAKIDGANAYLSFESGLYCLTFRDGTQRILKNPTGSINFGGIDSTVNVEVLYNSRTNRYQLWFIDYCPPKYPDGPRDRCLYWRTKFTSWSQKVDLAKRKLNGLFFKPYIWVPPNSDRTGELDLSKGVNFNGLTVPFDGVTMHDPYGSFVSFWKPWRTADIIVKREKDLLTFYDGFKTWGVTDPYCKFISDGNYEVIFNDGDLEIIHYRPDKQNSGEINSDTRNKLFAHGDGIVHIGPIRVVFPPRTLRQYLDNYGKIYSTVMSKVYNTSLTHQELLILYDLVFNDLQHHQKFEGYTLVSSWVEVLRNRSNFDPQKLWCSFIRANLIDAKYDPFKPVIKHFGNYRAVIMVGPCPTLNRNA